MAGRSLLARESGNCLIMNEYRNHFQFLCLIVYYYKTQVFIEPAMFKICKPVSNYLPVEEKFGKLPVWWWSRYIETGTGPMTNGRTANCESHCAITPRHLSMQDGILNLSFTFSMEVCKIIYITFHQLNKNLLALKWTLKPTKKNFSYLFIK